MFLLIITVLLFFLNFFFVAVTWLLLFFIFHIWQHIVIYFWCLSTGRMLPPSFECTQMLMLCRKWRWEFSLWIYASFFALLVLFCFAWLKRWSSLWFVFDAINCLLIVTTQSQRVCYISKLLSFNFWFCLWENRVIKNVWLGWREIKFVDANMGSFSKKKMIRIQSDQLKWQM